MPVGTIGLFDFQACKPQQANQLGGFVQVSFDQARCELRGIAAHVQEHGRLERIVWKGTGPGRHAAACNGQAIARPAKAMFAFDEPAFSSGNPIRQVDQTEDVVGIDDSCIFGQRRQIDARTCRAL